ncbi:MAG: flagellar hook-basal body complex protein FliE [Candidatus Pristimantibacillus lignocellulolyticus]|uniref:Flagellar hook-basal body complex protein FliE n=1 Tax=Candidatus Pristimantibacillus lignocellulolyticus TaxID=2994561 RepID=A0A9J6ZBL3_9BACL|nr:MAG: flagellar hook-basal body complex protein FliE [Candidatus Pristimantibacillus lignocellulolyticus]
MIESVSGISLQQIKSINAASNEKTTADITKSFGQFLNDALENVTAQEAEVHAKNDLYLAGKVDATELLITASQAQLTLQLTSQIRDKAVTAYQEIMRIQI